MKSSQFVPISDSENTAVSTDASGSGTAAMSAACPHDHRWHLEKNATQTAAASLAAHHVLVQPRQPRRPRERQRRLDHIASVVHLPDIGRRLVAGVLDAPPCRNDTGGIFEKNATQMLAIDIVASYPVRRGSPRARCRRMP